ncbi:hypothetical protein BJ741DRAFT_701493 [Chytriomyces cf. hyalinus JEL632]|nr:hypothetical protein BJ741DRAFT_701493 [Chytriomyces cf. hyalinus JEL632]
MQDHPLPQPPEPVVNPGEPTLAQRQPSVFSQKVWARRVPCDMCRTKRIRCDIEKPSCGFCRRREIRCVYSDRKTTYTKRKQMESQQVESSNALLHYVLPGLDVQQPQSQETGRGIKAEDAKPVTALSETEPSTSASLSSVHTAFSTHLPPLHAPSYSTIPGTQLDPIQQQQHGPVYQMNYIPTPTLHPYYYHPPSTNNTFDWSKHPHSISSSCNPNMQNVIQTTATSYPTNTLQESATSKPCSSGPSAVPPAAESRSDPAIPHPAFVVEPVQESLRLQCRILSTLLDTISNEQESQSEVYRENVAKAVQLVQRLSVFTSLTQISRDDAMELSRDLNHVVVELGWEDASEGGDGGDESGCGLERGLEQLQLLVSRWLG